MKIIFSTILSLLVVSPIAICQNIPRFQIVPADAFYSSRTGRWIYRAYLIDSVNGKLLGCAVALDAGVPISNIWTVNCGKVGSPGQPDVKRVRGVSATILSLRPPKGFSYVEPASAIWLVDVDSGMVTFCFTFNSCKSTKVVLSPQKPVDPP